MEKVQNIRTKSAFTPNLFSRVCTKKAVYHALDKLMYSMNIF